MNGTFLASVAAAACGVAGGVALGLRLGRRYRDEKWRSWLVYAGGLVVCVAACAAGLMMGQRWIAVGALGLLGGLMTGTKYGVRGGFIVAEPEVPAREQVRAREQ